MNLDWTVAALGVTNVAKLSLNNFMLPTMWKRSINGLVQIQCDHCEQRKVQTDKNVHACTEFRTQPNRSPVGWIKVEIAIQVF